MSTSTQPDATKRAWCLVDLGAEQLRWQLASPHPHDAPTFSALHEAPTLMSLSQERSFVQAAARQLERDPTWVCAHLVTLNDLPPTSPTSLPPQLPALGPYTPRPLSPRAPLAFETSSGQRACLTAEGERSASALLFELLSEVLTRPQRLGSTAPLERQQLNDAQAHTSPLEAPPLESATGPHAQSILWLRSAGHSPHGLASLSQTLSELSATSVALDSAVALTLGLQAQQRGAQTSPQRFAILDIGTSQASFYLTQYAPHSGEVEVLSERGRAGVGAHALEARLINAQLRAEGRVWERLDLTQRAQLAHAQRVRSYWATRLSWPIHLCDPQLAQLSPAEHELTEAYLDELAKLARLWLEEALRSSGLLVESLSALWLTGSVGLALSQRCRRFWPNLRVRYAPPNAALLGAQLALTSALTSARAPTHLTLQPCALWLTTEGRPPLRLLSPNTPTPAWVSALIDPSERPLQLWLCAEGQAPVLWGSHPPFQGAPRHLELSYESPESAHLLWSYQDGRAVPHAEGRWSLQLTHHPHALTPFDR